MRLWPRRQRTNQPMHVMPVGDEIVHVFRGCLCGPSVEEVTRADGAVGHVVVHHSLDGREKYE